MLTQHAQTGMQNQAQRPATELEGIIEEVRMSAFQALSSLEQIYARTVPPVPSSPTNSASIHPVASTYAEKVREVCGIVGKINLISTELNGKI